MSKVEIFDPAMCCSTGVCGPGVDPELLRMATIVNALQKSGKEVVRHNLAEEPQAFIDNKAINEVLMNEGADALPVTLVDHVVMKKRSYPTNEELMAWTGADIADLVGAIVKEEIENQSSGGCCGGNSCCC